MSPKIAQSIYQIGTIVPAVLGLLLIWNGIDAGAAENIDDITAGLVALLGSGAPATAAARVSKQRKDKLFDGLPSPVEQIITSLPAVVGSAVAANADLERVKVAAGDALGELVSSVPALGPLGQRIIDDARIPRD